MKIRPSIVCSVSMACAVFGPAQGQWLDYPTPGIPRTRNGDPDLGSAAPRTPERRPDLSGIWYAADGWDQIDEDMLPLPPDIVAELTASVGPPPESPEDPCAGGGCITQEVYPFDGFNIGRSLPGESLPYRPWARQAVMQNILARASADPHARCVPPTYPRAFVLPQHWKVVQTPELIVLLHEFNASYRQIFLDGRPLPEDPHPAWNGYSVGRWDGDTLVVETIGFRDDLWLDVIGSPLTEAARVTERFRRASLGTMFVEVTVDDPKAYTRPWTVVLEQRLVPDTELLDDICVENERSNRLLEE